MRHRYWSVLYTVRCADKGEIFQSDQCSLRGVRYGRKVLPVFCGARSSVRIGECIRLGECFSFCSARNDTANVSMLEAAAQLLRTELWYERDCAGTKAYYCKVANSPLWTVGAKERNAASCAHTTAHQQLACTAHTLCKETVVQAAPRMRVRSMA